MEQLLNFLQTNFPVLVSHKYVFLFLGSMIEGLNTMVLGGFLVSVKSLKFLPTFVAFVLGYTVNGYAWYAVGYFAGARSLDKWGRAKPNSERIINTIQHYFEMHSGKAIVITKLTLSLAVATLIMAGSLKYNLKRFSYYNFIGSVGWVMVTMFVGYFFGQSYRYFIVYLKNFTYFFVFLGGAVALIYILKLISRSAFIKSLLMHEGVKYLGDKISIFLQIEK